MNIVIYGSGILAELAHYYFTHDSSYRVAGFCLDREYMEEDTFLQLPVVPFDEVEKVFAPGNHAFFVAIGYSELNRVREKKCMDAKAKGYALASYISSSAVNNASKTGENCLVCENAVLQPFVELGDGSIVWAGALISHHTRIGNYCFVSPGATVSGAVRIGDYCFLGAGTAVRDRIKITDNVVVGMGSVVTNDLQEPGVYKGAPAMLSRSATSGFVI